ncbi:DUF188 domain-containing protein [Ruminococcus sp. Marseille-P6503]|uniref:YaiI/YqxD family protein n=1 Tax=Ruminococcus sp. Marseille-P6503 TaxID=2364796 RepID=UPI000F531F49|nr:DUF188 domain-containing protein [Ruminococcus sp. Marseille-P6503]
MKILIDADGCPVVEIAVNTAQSFGLKAIIISDTSHEYSSDYAGIIKVGKGADSADFRLANLVEAGDIAITQDYGLAAMVLAKNGIPIRQDGLVFSDRNIDSLLTGRYCALKMRRGGGYIKGSRRRTKAEDEAFYKSLCEIIMKNK